MIWFYVFKSLLIRSFKSRKITVDIEALNLIQAKIESWQKATRTDC